MLKYVELQHIKFPLILLTLAFLKRKYCIEILSTSHFLMYLYVLEIRNHEKHVFTKILSQTSFCICPLCVVEKCIKLCNWTKIWNWTKFQVYVILYGQQVTIKFSDIPPEGLCNTTFCAMFIIVHRKGSKIMPRI